MPKVIRYKPTWFPNGIRTSYLELGIGVGKLDPSGSNDAALVIQAALTNAATYGNDVVQLPPGTFKLTTYLNMPSNVILRGVGIGKTILKPTATASLSTTAGTASVVAFEGVSYSSVEDLTIDMSLRPTATNACGNGITFTAASIATRAEPLTYTGGGATTHFKAGLVLKGTTSGATATIVMATPTAATTGTLYLDKIVGTFVAGEAITDSSVGAATTVVTLPTSNLNTHYCAARRCQVIGRGAAANTYLIWIRGATDILVTECDIDGKLILETATLEFNNIADAVDNNGIELVGSRRVLITRNNIRNMGRVGIGIWTLDVPGAGSNNGVVVSDNIVDSCKHGIKAQSTYSTANGLKAINEVTVERNVITNIWNSGLGATHSAVDTLPQTLLLSAQTGTFVATARLTGGWSFATATIVSSSGATDTDTLTLTDVVGTFVVGEPLTDTSVGVGVSNGICSTNALNANYIIKGNVVDCSGALKTGAHSQFPVSINYSATGYSFPGCKFIDNDLRNAGGNSANGNLFAYANGWIIAGNSFDQVVASTTVDNVSIQNCLGPVFRNNRISNTRVNCMRLVTCTNAVVEGNYFYKWSLDYHVFSAGVLMQNCTGVKITDNYFDRSELAADSTYPLPIYGPDVNNTYLDIRGNRIASGSWGQGYFTPGVDESAYASGATFTHLQGTFTPGVGVSAFQVVHRDVQTTSQIVITQVVGTGVTETFITTIAAGSFTLSKYVATVATAFTATEKFYYRIVN